MEEELPVLPISMAVTDVYKRQVEAGSAPYVPRLFHDVYTGVDIRSKADFSKCAKSANDIPQN